MHKFLEIARTGVVAMLLHPLRSVVTTACLVAILVPYITGLGLSRGIQQQAEDSLRFGADLYVTGEQLGRNVPIPIAIAEQIRRIDGVTEVVPRIVGQTVLGKDRLRAVVVGVPPDRFLSSTEC